VTIVDLAVAYAGVGAVLALVAIVRWKASTVDALAVLAVWPLYAPVIAAGGDDDPREQALVDALRRAAGTPLAGALPDEAAARALVRRMRDGRARLAELDDVLARADLDEAAALARVAALERGGAHPGAIATAQRRVQTIRRMRALRDRFAGEIEQVDEVVTQLTAQLELVRFAGTADESAAAELAADLAARVESLDELFGNDLVGARVPPP
jgi:hypothetical protein